MFCLYSYEFSIKKTNIKSQKLNLQDENLEGVFTVALQYFKIKGLPQNVEW